MNLQVLPTYEIQITFKLINNNIYHILPKKKIYELYSTYGNGFYPAIIPLIWTHYFLYI